MLNPLTDEHCNCLNRVLEQTPPALELAQACIDCGFEFGQQFKERLLEQQRQATLLKAKFFPHRP